MALRSAFRLFCIFFATLVSSEKLQSPMPSEPGEPFIYPTNYCLNMTDNMEFDFIVIGSGPGGATVARRLAEIESNNVLLLEAGQEPPISTDIPLNAGNYPTKGLAWDFKTAPSSTDCTGFIGRSCPLPIGRTMGGSSSVNIMMYVRGNHQDFDDIAALGNEGWSYEDMLPYFKKLENYVAHPLDDGEENIDGEQTVDEDYHNVGGPLTTAKWAPDPLSYPLQLAIEKTFTDIGIPENLDFNGEKQIGHTRVTGMVDQIGYRYSVVKAYLTNLPDNMKVCKGATATRILIENKQATGVEFIFNDGKHSKKRVIRGKKDYIISGGSYNSPALLERSGIGRKDVLQKAGVKLIHSLPGVGENLQDHYLNMASAFKFNPLTQTSPNPLTIGITQLSAFINTTDPESLASDTQLVFALFNINDFALFGNYKPEIRKQFEQAGPVVHFMGIPLREATPGSTHITQSKDPNKTPLIKQGSYSTPEEVRQIVNVTRMIRETFAHPNLEPFQLTPLILNECKKYPFNSEKEIMCSARMLTRSIYHTVGSAGMGPESNPMAVVDSRLRVHGIKNLRVVDSSVLPLTTRGNTEIPTVATAEKAADLIKEDYDQLEPTDLKKLNRKTQMKAIKQ